MRDDGRPICLGFIVGFLMGAALLSVLNDVFIRRLEQKAVKAGVAHHEINQDTGRVELMFHPAK